MRAHLASAEQPLIEGGGVFTVCGGFVQYSLFVFWFRDDVQDFADAVNCLNICSKCRAARNCITGRYVYGVVEAKRGPQSESVEEREVITA